LTDILPGITTDEDLFRYIEKRLYTAVICDSLDHLGAREQAMREYLRPVHSGFRMAGWARTILCRDVYELSANPYEKEIEAVDSILPGEIVVVTTQRSIRNAPWGELLSTAAKARGGRGAVVDGFIRDVMLIEQLGFPVFAAGIKPLDSAGRGIVQEYNVPVDCGGVLVHPGDLVVTDYDGIVVVPRRLVAETIRLASDKVSRENNTRRELKEGAFLRDVYAKYGVL